MVANMEGEICNEESRRRIGNQTGVDKNGVCGRVGRLAEEVRTKQGEMLILGLSLKKAYTYLGNVTEHKQCIPFRRFAGAVGRTAQATEFKTTKGEWNRCWN
jgi:hypothetical protein